MIKTFVKSVLAKQSSQNPFCNRFQCSHMLSKILGLGALLSAVCISAGVDTNTGDTSTASTTNQLNSSPTLQILGVSYTSDTGGASKDFVVRFTEAEMLWLNKIKTVDSFVDNASNGVLVPVAVFDLCVDASAATIASTGTQLSAKVNIGAYTDGSSNAINAYVLLKGNNQASPNDNSVGQQYLLFGSDGTKAENAARSLNTTVIPTSGLSQNTLVTTAAPSATDDPIVGTDNQFWPFGAAVTAGRVTGDGTASGSLNHYNFSSANYTLNTTSVADTADAAGDSFMVDESYYTGAAACGADSNNYGAVKAYVYLDLADILSNPTGTYNGSVAVTLTYA